MIHGNDCGLVVLPPFTQTQAGTDTMSFSKLDGNGQPFDHCILDIHLGTHVTNASAVSVQSIVIAESDTVTSPSSMTSIAALSGSAATSTNHAWAIPAVATSGKGGIIRLQIDLRKRKKYLGMTILGAAAASNVCIVGAVAQLGRSKESKDSAAGKSLSNLAATNAQGCMALVTG